MVKKQSIRTARRDARFGMKAGALLLGMSVLASCSMFDENSMTEPEAGAAPTAEAGPGRAVVEDVPAGLPGDAANRAYDESLGRRPVTTVRPLEEAVEPAPQPEAPQQSQAAPAAPEVAAAPVEPVEPVVATAPAQEPDPAPSKQPEAAPAPTPAPAPPPASAGSAPADPGPEPLVRARVPQQPAPEPEVVSEPAAPAVAEAPAPAQGRVLGAAARPGGAEVATETAAPTPSAPAPRPTLVADTGALDAAAAAAYSGRVAAPPSRAATLVPGAAASAPSTGPVVIGGAASPSGAMGPRPGGPVVIGGPRGGAAPVVDLYEPGFPRAGMDAAGPGGEPVAVIQFDFGSAHLDARDRRVLRQVADLQARRGGFVKVVGHSSRFTANMPRERHMLVNFETSVARAEVVAQALRAEGVPPEMLDVAAIGDREPIFEEVMPAGQAGNQRVEIYLFR